MDLGTTSELGCGQVVRQRFLVACTVGSNPTTPASTHNILISIFFMEFLSVFSGSISDTCLPQTDTFRGYARFCRKSGNRLRTLAVCFQRDAVGDPSLKVLTEPSVQSEPNISRWPSQLLGYAWRNNHSVVKPIGCRPSKTSRMTSGARNESSISC